MDNKTFDNNFDLISDLYLDNLDNFSWQNKATSLCCVVAGNIAEDRTVLSGFFAEISKYYEKVFFIDGSLEHSRCGGNFITSYSDLSLLIKTFSNVYFLHENIIIFEDMTLLATNGWTSFDFVNPGASEDNIEFLDIRGIMPAGYAMSIQKMAQLDSAYLTNSIAACQTMVDSSNIVVITSTVPLMECVEHDHEYSSTILGDMSGNRYIENCLNYDTEEKVSTWVFGTYSGEMDISISGIRFVNHPGKDKDLDIYYPKLINFS